MAHKNSLLTKRREPKPTNSACTEFANQTLNSLIRTPVSLAEKHSKAKTGKLSPEFGFAEFSGFGTRQLVKQETGVQSQNSANAEFWSFCTRLLIKQELPDAKAPLSLEF